MNIRIVSGLLFAASLTGCSGGGVSSSLPSVRSSTPVVHPTIAPSPTFPTGTLTCKVAHCLAIRVPKRTGAHVASKGKRPLYVSASTQSGRISIVQTTKQRADGLYTGVSLKGYPIVAALTPTSPGCSPDASGNTICVIPLTGIPENGKGFTSLASSVELFDGQNASGDLVGVSVTSAATPTFDNQHMPTAYSLLDFGTVNLGGSNFATVTVAPVIGSVSVVQEHGFAELTAGNSPLTTQFFDAGGVQITSAVRYVTPAGLTARFRFLQHSTESSNVETTYTPSYSCPAGDPNAEVPQVDMPDATCTATLAYSGANVGLPTAYLAANGGDSTTPGDFLTPNILTGQGSGDQSLGTSVEMGTFIPVIQPVSLLNAPETAVVTGATIINFNDMGYGVNGYSQNPNGGFYDANDCGQNASLVTVDEAHVAVTGSIPSECVESAVLYEPFLSSSAFQATVRESEQIPVVVGGAAPSETSVQVTPASQPLAASGTVRVSQYGTSANPYSVSTGWCVGSDQNYPYPTYPTDFPFNSTLSNGANGASLLGVSPASFTLNAVSYQDVALTKNTTRNVLCEVDLSPDFGPSAQPANSNGPSNSGAKYYETSVF